MGIAEGMRKLREDIEASYDRRMAGIAELKKETGNLMRESRIRRAEWKEDLGALSRSLKSLLNGSESQRMREFSNLHQDIRNRQVERKEEDQERARVLKSMLADYDAQRSQNMATMLDGFRKESRAARAEWRRMASTLQAKRAGRKVAPPPPLRKPVKAQAPAGWMGGGGE